jgi:hypothetical protein
MIDSSSVLHHATPRIFCGCGLHPGVREELLGFSPMTERKNHGASVAANLWRAAVSRRIRNPQVMESAATTRAATITNFFAGAQASQVFEEIETNSEDIEQIGP